ncbi:16S rRNA (guanine(966)-N(2))-methyltransferase RsmD [soil metagenome]
MTRIVAGTLGGRRLETPPGAGTRPTSDRVREALFSRVESLLGGLTDAEVLDLFAGSGAVGLEALSRGAARAVLVESDRRSAAVVRRNADALGVADRAEVLGRRVERIVTEAPRVVADLVFADPPYAADATVLRDALAAALAGGWCAPGALLVVERSTRAEAWRFPDGVVDAGERRYGQTTLWYGRRA